MNCTKCGAPLKEGAKFCTKCGAKVEANANPIQDAGDKGILDNLAHLGTFIQRGSTGVQREIRNEQRERIQREAEAAGLEVRKPGRNGQQNGDQPRERRLSVSSYNFDDPGNDTLDLVGGRAIWNINKGELARRITEKEFANVEGLKGVIIQEGCSALVYVDGQMVSIMQAGCYTFPTKTQTEIQLEQREKELKKEITEFEKLKKQHDDEFRKESEKQANTFASRGVFGEAAAFGRGVMNFLFGKKKDEKPESHKARVERTREKLQKIPAPKVCRVYIVSNRVINMLFGSVETDGSIDFAPMVIPTRLVDVEIAVAMQLQITNMMEFVTNYLADRNTLSTSGLQKELALSVKTVLSQVLRNLDYEANGLPEPVVDNLKKRLMSSLNERLNGIQVVKVNDITDRSADFDRFRSVERELFASEKELDFLQRTNEFRNRLEQEQNKPIINGALNAEELRKALQAINKDKIVSEDEMEQFVMLLESQKRLREATTKEQEYEALMDLKKNHLVKEDDVAALENTLAQGKISRENVTDIMRIQASQKITMAQQIAEFELSDSKRDHDMANALREARHKGELTSVELDTRRLADAYDDERNEFNWNRAFERRKIEDDYDFNSAVRNDDREWEKRQREEEMRQNSAQFNSQLNEAQAQAEHDRKMAENAAANKFELDRMAQLIAARNAAMETMQKTEQARIDAEKVMTQEQIAAAHMKDIAGLDKDAQKAMAEMMGSGNSVKADMLAEQNKMQSEMYEKMLQMMNANMAGQQQNSQITMQQMMQMMQMLQQGMVGVAGAQMMNQQQQFQQQQAFQQQRYDDQVALKQEYQQQAQYAQQRQDNAQDQAFGAMGGVAQAAASNLGAFNGGFNGVQPQQVQPAVQRFCPGCGAVVPDGDIFCEECGFRIE